MEDWPYRLLAFVGFFVIAFVSWLTGRRGRLNWRTIAGSVALAWGLGLVTFWFPGSRWILSVVNDVVVAMLAASQKGSLFLLGPLALGPGQTLLDGTASIGFILAAQALPAVVFFASVMSGLYYLGVMQAVVRVFARLFYRTMGLSGAEALSGAANIFVGIEAGLIVQPFLAAMTGSELVFVLTCMMATVASTVMGIYVGALHHVVPQIAGHLISASVIAIPCAVLASKLAFPETEHPATLGGIPIEAGATRADRSEMSAADAPSNLIVSLIEGAGQGVRMAVGIATLLIVFLGLEALLDLALGQLPFWGGTPLSVARVFAWLTWPFTILLGLRPDEWSAGADLLGSRFVETEVSAYFRLAALQSASPPAFSTRSLTTMTYALCGFVHFASMGIFVGGIAALVPGRAKDLSILGFRALWTAFLTTLMTGCIAGVLAAF
ncbi:nucleoside permease [Nitrospira sp. KM1]|uniref:NupC/NupG family nucleoside CNT transporter n=1 Tax=Nitrospira sp. KM1 TaxID=1936990 RepID=UPI0013A74524|nr:nucleoside transporter C-terminal domain-containing protein [Nitrospira sp. KM1]BCA52956.1 nucleoside permease [Nitrospira sp. KM1]